MQVQEGEGWRLAHDPSRAPYPVLVGGCGWAAELSLLEARSLQEGLCRLRQQHRSLETLLMPEEQVSLELELQLEPEVPAPPSAGPGAGPGAWEAGSLWLGLDGDRQRWALRFVLSPGGPRRGVEGAWQEGASAAIAAALALLPLADPCEIAGGAEAGAGTDQRC